MTDVAMAVLEPGFYVSPIKLAGMLVLLAPWLYLAPWVEKDARKVHSPGSLWGLTVLGVGALSVLIWLVVPVYILGLLVFVLLTYGALLGYAMHRDQRVEPEERVLTRQRLTALVRHEKPQPIQPRTQLKLYRQANRIVLPPGPDADPELLMAYNAAQDLLHDLVWRRAGEATLTPTGNEAKLRFIIDGVPVDRPSLKLSQSEGVIQYLKDIGGMDVADRRRPQAGKIAVDATGQQVEIELRSAGTTGGQRMQFRVVQEFVRTKLDTLGMSEDTLGRIMEVNKSGPGLIIVSGRSGSGVTSTLYSLLREFDAFMQQLVTLEQKPAVDLDNIHQQTYASEKLPQTLSALLRRDPDVVMVDQCRDSETAQVIVTAAQEKSLLLGMRADDTFSALAKWVQLVGNPEAAVTDLKALLCQMLLRKLCPSCREPYRPDPQMLAKANLSGQNIDRFYRPPSTPVVDEKGNPIICSTCQGMGYVDRTAVFELLQMTDDLRGAIIKGASLSQIKAIARKSKTLYLQEMALQKVIEGATSVQELIRVTQPPRAKAAK
jgi:type II secretory ATPase GspE/PulE/Tfp pilus assembly ATPase PilB-like protein